MRGSVEPTWRLVLAAAQALGAAGASFTREALIRQVQRADPGRDPGSIGPVIQGMTVNATGGPSSECGTPLRRLGRGLYCLEDSAALDDDPTPTTTRGHETRRGPSPRRGPRSQGSDPREGTADVVLVGCVKTKLAHPARAADLYASPLFRGRRNYAEGSGRPWFILSSRWGLLTPEEVVEPYDHYLGDESAGYRQAWGAFVAEQLPCSCRIVDGPDGGTPRRCPLPGRAGRAWARPSPGTRPRLSPPTTEWTTPTSGPSTAPLIRPHPAPAQVLRRRRPQPPPSWRTSSPTSPIPHAASVRPRWYGPTRRGWPPRACTHGGWTPKVPADLSAGAALGIGPGLAYAGLAGATDRPSGRRSTNTLWSRLTGMHLGNRAKFSTFRRTLAALLREPLALTSEDNPRLSDWIARHLAVSPIVVQDADALGRLETAVLHQLDPPLNLRGMPPTPLRTRISTLRTTHAPEQ